MTSVGQVRIGTAGWNVPRASARQFSSAGTHLARYARVLNCAEINTSFYRPHRQSTWERWREAVPEDFRFSVKAPKAITHEAELKCQAKVLDDFLLQTRFLGEKLGTILFQLPPGLEFNLPNARSFLKLLRDRFQGGVAWEPRHPSWFDDRATDLLLTFEIARVAADPARVPKAELPGAYDKLVYFRLHGSPRRYYSSYDDEFLAEVALKTNGLRGRAEVWCIFDNTASGAAIENALRLEERLKRVRV